MVTGIRRIRAYIPVRTTYESLTKKQRAELLGYVSWPVQIVRAILFLGIIFLVGAALKSLHAAFAPKQGFASNSALWIIPSLAFAAWFYFRWQRWTGGARGAANIRNDLTRGEIANHHVQVVDAIEIEELEDEGPSYFLLTSENEVLYFSGQWLDREKRRGFPWKSFEIREAPLSKVFFGLKKTGERFPPSFIRKPLDWETLKKYRAFKGKYRVLNEDFESLKRDPHEVVFRAP
jgi:hypothetical protein